MRLQAWLPLGLTISALALWGLSCTDALPPSPPPPNSNSNSDSALVSDPLRHALPEEPDVAYISMPPSTFPGGVLAVIRNPRGGGSVTAAVIDGGFDALPIRAVAGDEVEIAISLASGPPVVTNYKVPVTRRPRVIRTVPSKGKTDVPLNPRIVIVFSEPVSEATLSSASVQLLRGGNPVAGTVHIQEGATASAVFEPAAALDANATYQIVVTEAVRDLQGDPLEVPVTSEFHTSAVSVLPATVVTVLPDTTAVAVGSYVQLVAEATDTNGVEVAGRAIAWSIDDQSVATVSSTGLVTAMQPGAARVRATLDGRSDVAVILVSGSLPPVASMSIVPDTSTVLIGGLVRLNTVLKDSDSNVVKFRPIGWSSSDPSIAEVVPGPGGTAVVTRVASGTVTITAISEGKFATATIRSGAVGPYTQVSANGTCALTTAFQAWCWGGGNVGQGGNGTRLSTLVPSAVAGGHAFAFVASGSGHECALTAGGEAWCWGDNHVGAVGIGAVPSPSAGCREDDGVCMITVPMSVVGGLRFSAIGADEHTCALTTDGLAYCWGPNVFGQLGVGSKAGPEHCGTWMIEGDGCSTKPVQVQGNRSFIEIGVGYNHTCALTASGTAFCWGWNHSGVLGDASPSQLDRAFPVQVAGGLVFTTITVGGFHNCGLTANGDAYCWGMNEYGELGTGSLTGPQTCAHTAEPQYGTTNCATVPVKVAGNLRFRAISAGFYHTCGLTTTGVAYCWGDNSQEQLGVGATPQSVPAPTRVLGNVTFSSLSVGYGHNCGIATDGRLYCWGYNSEGQLGNGSTVSSSVPVRVAGQP
jgi:alpha-tubulin suppressor-like RCC1 family protein